MTDLFKIEVHIITSDINDAGTDGSVYLGICGREFRCDTSADDFEHNSSRTYVFGDGANVINAAANDPRMPQLILEDVDYFPVYIRFEQDGGGGHWNLQRAQVNLNGANLQQYDSRIGGPEGLWLGKNSGAFYYLHRHINGRHHQIEADTHDKARVRAKSNE